MAVPMVGYYDFHEEEQIFIVVTLAFWNTHGGVDINASEEAFMPPGFAAISEGGYYEHDYDSTEDAAKALEDAGFVKHSLGDG